LQENNKRIKYACFFIFLILADIIVYSFLHEMGHMLIGIIKGGKITAFKVGIGAYVSIVGAKHSMISLPLLNAFGALLPYIINFVLILFYKESMNDFIKLSNFFFTVAVAASIIPWVIIPFLYLNSNAPAGDDVTKFLDSSKISPLLVSLIAFLLIFMLLYISLKVKRIHMAYIKILKELNKKDSNIE